LLVRSFLWLGLIEAGLCYAGFLTTYLFSGNAAILNIAILNTIQWPRLFTISGDVNVIAQTVFLAGVVTSQIGNAFACRTSKAHITQMGWGSNKILLSGILLALVLLAGLIYLPAFARAFDNQVFPLILWPLLLIFAPTLYTLEWFRKAIIRWMGKKQVNLPSNSEERRR
jgi:magnesium-transporting ATPase (P-type)